MPIWPSTPGKTPSGSWPSLWKPRTPAGTGPKSCVPTGRRHPPRWHWTRWRVSSSWWMTAGGPFCSTPPKWAGMGRWEEPVTPSLYTLSVSVAALLAAADMADERSQPGIATYCRKTADYLYEHIDAWTWFNGYYTSGGRPVPNLPPTPDVLALVRFGLRKPDDPRILDTLKALDSTLRVDTAYGPAWK